MKKLLTTLSMVAIIALSACNRGGEQTTDAVGADSAAAAPAEATTPAFTPFDVVQINHSVNDYAKWRTAFDNDSTARKASGLDFIVIGAQDDNTSNVAIFLQAADVAKAKAFAADPRLKDVMDKNGVTSKPDINYWHVIRFDPNSKEKHWVTVTHKVKDFDAWLKVYDGEGTAKRLEEGMVDVVLARGVDDTNKVFVVFDIVDMSKAKAAMASDEKRNLMLSAGVEGEPEMVFYTEPK